MSRATVHIPDEKIDDFNLVSAKEQLRIFQMSVNGKWLLPPDTRRGIAGFAASIVADENQGVRSRINASKLLLSIDALQSQELRACSELTLRFEAAAMNSGSSEGLAHLVPPDPYESMTDDTPASSPMQGGEHEGS
jgi:hypothetical protein